MISVLCLAELLQCFSSHESCVTSCHPFPCCLVFHRIFGSTALHAELGVRIIAAARRPCHLSQDTLGSRSVLYLTNIRILGMSLVHDESISTRSRCSSAARLHGSFVTVKTQASSRPSGHRARVILLQSTVIALYFVLFFLRPAQHAHAVFARISVHGSPNPQFLSASITKIDGSSGSSSGWRCTTARQAMCALVQDTSARSLFVFMCRRSETSTCGLCKAADVQRSGPGPGRRAPEAV